jgi:hypothetical protein
MIHNLSENTKFKKTFHMKRSFIGSLVGGLIIFFWQFLSNSALDLHRVNTQYTPKQDTILNFLSSQLEEGKYFLPNFPAGSTADEMEKQMASAKGKPWAIVDYKKSNDTNMPMNMGRGLITNIIMVWLFIWLLTKGNFNSFGNIFTASLAIGVLSFLFFPYTNFIWYESPGIYIDMLDALMGWGLTGVWLGAYLRKR